MKYLFILGRNPELSIAEVFSYLERDKIKVNSFFLKENGLFVDIDGKLPKNVVDKLGGVISIGEILVEVSGKKGFDDLIQEIDKIDLYSEKSNKFNYVVWDFAPEIYEDFSEYLKDRFRSEKLKPTNKKLGGFLEMQNDSVVRILDSKVDKQFFVFSSENHGVESFYFGEVVQETNYSEIEKRDMKKPVRREELSISPRLAKILINLSQVKDSQTLLDPFCGIGVVLTEALIQGINVVGIDKDKKAIEGCEKNLKYFGFKENRYKLINWDSSTAEIRNSINGIASEPDFGEIHGKMVDEKKANVQIKKFEELMINVLNNLKKYNKGKFVFTFPTIRTNRGRVGPNYEKIMEFTGLGFAKIKGFDAKFPIQEFRKNQVVGREIVVFEKV